MSINSAAFFTARKAASQTSSGVPTIVTTVRLVALPGSTSIKRTPSTASISFVICLMIFISFPSEKLGTHSINFFILLFINVIFVIVSYKNNKI